MPRKRDDKLLREVGKRVAHVRKDRGWTQEQLAEAIGIEAVSLSRLETGDRALSLSTLARISDALNVELGDLLDVQRDIPASDHAPDEAELLRRYRELPENKRDIVLRLVRDLTSG